MLEYLGTLNTCVYIFQKDILQQVAIAQLSGKSPPNIGWEMAVNCILAHCMQMNLNNAEEGNKYIRNALNMLPQFLTTKPTPLGISAQLCLVYILFS
jgi:hypothetical protein